MNARDWPLLRQRRAPHGRHRALPTITETDMPANLAASLPQYDYRPTAALQQGALEPAFGPPADPSRQVQCTFCSAIGLAADMPDHGRGPRCYPDTEGCGRRWAAGKPVSLLPHVAEALEPLPEDAPAPAVRADITDAPGDVMRTWAPPAYAQEAVDRHLATRGEGDAAEPEDAADAAEQAATEALARWAPGETLTEDEEPEAPHSQADVTYLIPDEDMIVAAETPERAEEAAQALAEHLGPDEQGSGEDEAAEAEGEPQS